MEATKIRKDTFKHIEQELYAYHDTKKEIIKLKNEIMYASAPPNTTGGGRGNLPGNPTESTVTALMMNRRISHLQSIVDAVESVYQRLPDEKQKLINLYYFARPKILTWDGIADKLHISRITAIRWRDEIIYAVNDSLGWR